MNEDLTRLWPHVERILDELFDLPEPQRSLRLAEACAGDAALERMVRDLLRADHDSFGFFDSVPAMMLGEEGADTGAETEILPVERIGPFRIVRELGRGGMGTVLLGERDDGEFEQRVAIKLLHRELATGDLRETLLRERRILARLEHPNIARMFDGGVTATGEPYFVMEHVDGQRIDDYCDAQRLELEGRVRLFLDVSAAVAFSHANLIVHRDLKPANVLVGKDRQVKLLDFGIAKVIEPDSGKGAARAITRLGETALTPEYAAPEQLTGGPITTATDVYALGVLLFVLLTGRHPVGASTMSPAEWIKAVVEGETPLPSAAVLATSLDLETRVRNATRRCTDPKRLSRLLQGDLDNIVAKALKKAPPERYPSVEALADDLRRHLDQKPISARPDTLGYRLGKFIRRNRVAVIAGGLTAAGLVTTTAVSLEQTREARWQRDQALFEKKRADTVSEFQTLLLTSVGTGRVTMREIVDQGKVLLEREYAGEPDVAAGLALLLAGRYADLGEYELQAEMLDRAESLAALGGAKDVPLLIRCQRASNLLNRGLEDQASALLDGIQPELATAAPLDVSFCLQRQVSVEVRAGRFDSAVAIGRRAVAILEGLGTTTMRRVSALNTLANALENAKRRREALEIYHQIAQTLDSTGRDKTATRNAIRNNIGIALSNLGEMIEAEKILQETIEEFLRSNPTGYVHPAILVNYCRTVLFLRKLDAAGTWYERLYRQAEARNDLAMQQDAASGMADVELLRGRLDEARRWIAEVKRLEVRLPTPSPASGLALDGALAHARGDAEAARQNFREALLALGYAEGKRTYQMRSRLIRAAEAALEADAPSEALEYARAAHGIATSDALTETRSAYVGEARLIEARGLLATGDRAAARTVLAQALTALRTGAGPEHPRVREAESLLSQLAR